MRGIIAIAILDLLFLSIGVIGAAGVPRLFYRLTPGDVERLSRVPGLFGGGHPAFLSLAMGAIALVTFLGILRLGVSSRGSGPDEPWIQRAIVIAVVTVYLVLVSVVTFFRGAGDQPEVTTSLLGSFTATVSVIVAFYFGSSAYLEATRAREKP